MQTDNWQGLKKSIGPGLLIAAAAIGVSHLVQSTRAGADYGFALVWAVVLANIFKYPFLEFGPRYAAATGETMIEGFQRLGRWAIWFYILFTISTMFIIYAAVTLVTASLAAELTGIALDPFIWSILILLICISLMFSGKYSVLDGAIKVVIAVLTISTLTAVAAAFLQQDNLALQTVAAPPVWSVGGVAFLIALMGWMPIPIDAAAWHSIWSVERFKQTRYKSTLRESLVDFNIGYIGAAVLALCFLLLGALVMYGSGESFASSGAAFSTQLISLYTRHLGDWAYPVIVIAAFTTMFSTTLTVTDAYPRACRKFIEVMAPGFYRSVNPDNIYRALLLFIAAFSLLFSWFLGSRFTYMIDLAATLSFLGAPVLGYINYRLVTMENIPEEMRPKPWLLLLTWSGLIFLSGFALIYLYWMMRF